MTQADSLAALANLIARAGRTRLGEDTTVNPPVQRASTVLFSDVGDLYRPDKRTYGLEGLAAHDALRGVLAQIEGGAGCTLAPSGLAACTLALLAFVSAGDEVLVTDSVYKPTRRFCETFLARFGVQTRYYDPRIGGGIEGLFTAKTRAVMLESPGSLTFEVQDVPAIAQAARARGIKTLIDNTWSAGVFFKPFAHGVDVSIQALTKYQAGHADALMGAVICGTAADQARVEAANLQLGLGCGADDVYLVLRGLRTMPLRLAHQSAAGLKIARWLQDRAEVGAVLHPGLEASADHALFQRDFTGAGGVFGFTLAKPASEAALKRMLEGMRLLSMGFSWGGFESLIVPCDAQIVRSAAPWNASGPLLRVSIGLESPEDLIGDLADGLGRL